MQQGFEPLTSRSADRHSPKWANQVVVTLQGVKKVSSQPAIRASST